MVVHLVEADAELLDDLADDGHDQGGPDALEHAVERASEAVVVEAGRPSRRPRRSGGKRAAQSPTPYMGSRAKRMLAKSTEQGGDGGELSAGVVLGRCSARTRCSCIRSTMRIQEK